MGMCTDLHAFVTICTILVVLCAKSLDYKEKSTTYLFQLILENNTHYIMKSVQKNQIHLLKIKTKFFENFIFPAVKGDWNNLAADIQNSAFCNILNNVIQTLLDLSLIKYLILIKLRY